MSIKQLRLDYLTSIGIEFKATNNSEHIMIPTIGGRIDYWPSTGKYFDNASGFRGDDNDMFQALVRHRRDGKPVMVHSPRTNEVVDKPMALSGVNISALHTRIAELEEMLHKVIDAWVDNSTLPAALIKEVNALVMQKPEAHSTKLPWEE